MEQEIPKPPDSDPSFNLTFAGATYRCWIVREVMFYMYGTPSQGDHWLIQIDPQLDIAKARMTWKPYLDSGLAHTAFLIRTDYDCPKDGLMTSFCAPATTEIYGRRRFDAEACIYCGHLGETEPIIAPEIYEERRDAEFRRNTSELARTCFVCVLLLGLFVTVVMLILHRW